MLTRDQKSKLIQEIKKAVDGNGSLLIVDFSKVKTSDLGGLRVQLREQGAELKVFKKRLLKIAFKEAGVALDPEQFPAQAGVIFAQKDILSIAGLVYKFSKKMAAGDKVFKVLGGYEIKDNKPVAEEDFMVLANLPSREILLAQLAIVFSMPMKKLAYVLNSRKEQLEK